MKNLETRFNCDNNYLADFPVETQQVKNRQIKKDSQP